MRRICGQTMGVVWVGCFGALAACTALGDTNAAAAGLVQHVSLGELFDKGGPMLYVLTAMSVIGLALVIFFFAMHRRQQFVPDGLYHDVMGKLRQGYLADARIACGSQPCAFAEITVAALDFVEDGKKPDSVLLKEVIEGEGNRQATAMQTQLQYLLDIGVIAPMVGLLGTVFGMVKAFNVVAFDVAKAKPMLLAGGVAEAMINTAGGLIVGIPAMMFYAYFRGRASKLVSHMESVSLEVLSALVRSRAP